jgi:hypothetical protein
MLCTRCGEGDALASDMIVGSTVGAFCQECVRALVLGLIDSAGNDPAGESRLTPDQIADGLLRITEAISDLPPGASPEQLRRALGGEKP